jgi:hypothetical protein
VKDQLVEQRRRELLPFFATPAGEPGLPGSS